MFVNQSTLVSSLQRVYGTANHLLKIWFALKQMGFAVGSPPIEIDTSNSTDALRRLFSYGSPDNGFFVPFSHTPRFAVMKHDASRSIIQTTIQRWAASGSVVTCDPTEYLDFSRNESGNNIVSPGRRYPIGLGYGESGFALDADSRVAIPIVSFAVWYGRQRDIPPDSDPSDYLVRTMLVDLNISSEERQVIFVDDDLRVETQQESLTNEEIFAACSPFISGEGRPTVQNYKEDFDRYSRRVKSMVSNLELPVWMRTSPLDEVRELIGNGAKAILLYGPPRTGKTRIIDLLMARASGERCTIQIHDGWGYDHLVEGFKPDVDGAWRWVDGPLKSAIEGGKKIIVLEEINRTSITQALGEVFSLIEEAYRGAENGIVLRSGKPFFVPTDVVFLMTMNTVDKSTEEVDDALMGRVAAVEFPPRPEDLSEMLSDKGIEDLFRNRLAQLFAGILTIYPLGHGYFAGISREMDKRKIIGYYKTRIRPVLFNFLGDLKSQELAQIDNLVDELFGG